MHLEPKARKYYQVKIVTEPEAPGTWEASFDGGATWETGEEGSTDIWRWLIAGPEFDPEGEADADYIELEAAPYTPVLLKLGVDPEVLVLDGPTIYIKD